MEVDLPDDILVLIFRSLSLVELTAAAAKVSRRFRRLALHAHPSIDLTRPPAVFFTPFHIPLRNLKYNEHIIKKNLSLFRERSSDSAARSIMDNILVLSGHSILDAYPVLRSYGDIGSNVSQFSASYSLSSIYVIKELKINLALVTGENALGEIFLLFPFLERLEIVDPRPDFFAHPLLSSFASSTSSSSSSSSSHSSAFSSPMEHSSPSNPMYSERRVREARIPKTLKSFTVSFSMAWPEHFIALFNKESHDPLTYFIEHLVNGIEDTIQSRFEEIGVRLEAVNFLNWSGMSFSIAPTSLFRLTNVRKLHLLDCFLSRGFVNDKGGKELVALFDRLEELSVEIQSSDDFAALNNFTFSHAKTLTLDVDLSDPTMEVVIPNFASLFPRLKFLRSRRQCFWMETCVKEFGQLPCLEMLDVDAINAAPSFFRGSFSTRENRFPKLKSMALSCDNRYDLDGAMAGLLDDFLVTESKNLEELIVRFPSKKFIANLFMKLPLFNKLRKLHLGSTILECANAFGAPPVPLVFSPFPLLPNLTEVQLTGFSSAGIDVALTTMAMNLHALRILRIQFEGDGNLGRTPIRSLRHFQRLERFQFHQILPLSSAPDSAVSTGKIIENVLSFFGLGDKTGKRKEGFDEEPPQDEKMPLAELLVDSIDHILTLKEFIYFSQIDGLLEALVKCDALVKRLEFFHVQEASMFMSSSNDLM